MDKTKALQNYNPDEALLSEVSARIREVERIALAKPAVSKISALFDQRTVEAAQRHEARIAHLAEKLGIDKTGARLTARALDSLDSLALEIADKLEWDHEGDAFQKATEAAVPDDWSPEGMAARFFNPDYELASAYLQVRKITESVERGDLLWAIGDLADVARRTLGDDSHRELSATNSANAKSGWSWLDEVAQVAVDRRKADLKDDPVKYKARAASVRKMLPEIRALYDEKGRARNVRLHKDEHQACRTIDGWLVAAGIR
ncbi:hypothetical protein [Pseudoxanthomonas indica]|uniref:Uncharacterized protein n=1 Tax=Pseudoxanthomonas indica TaxID=428993 RepID=A0A1T5JEY6_9GAMM|nr:hypothetical protein [Pseudoxanthomonas indica]GGD58289.1 hypothetical protein GCM10007235_33280 [Pseudoxanthomonas indica]SKC49969.1 hypothetical protein SAMN06296058_0748 [Pseudoxanthomonas indica]